MSRALPLLAVIALALSACGAGAMSSAPSDITPHVAGECSGAFISHELPHLTTGSQSQTTLFDGTGSGVAVEDLNGDDLPDIVLANLSGASTILWNQGDLKFDRRDLVTGRFRHVSIADANNDQLLDIILTTGIGTPVLMKNLGATTDEPPSFERTTLDGVTNAAYSMAWADLGGDGDLDLVTGGYNAELTANRDVSSLLGVRGGVSVYEYRDGFEEDKITDLAQALVVRFTDIDGDDQLDVWVGNDLATPDEVYLNRDGSWKQSYRLPVSTFSTMSLDRGDIDNDGDFDLFATDMHPMDDLPETQAAWEPIFEDMASQPVPDSNQLMENVLVAPDGSRFDHVDVGLRHTGWSWSGLFGDLDNDTMLDVYVVNGMEAASLFAHVPGAALVEENQAFRNAGATMEPAPQWGLADTAGGRGMAMADLDRDGDLDIVVNNLNSPSRLFENQVCGGGSITVSLNWQGAADHRAVGATIVAEVGGKTLSRQLDTTRGYLSTSPAEAHFGLGDAARADVTVTWPDGTSTDLGTIEAGNHVEATTQLESS